MMVGIPGSGKSFFAEQFAKTFNTPYVDSLDIEQRAADAASAGQIVALILEQLTRTQQTFIYEGNSDTRTGRTEFARWARERGYQPLFIWTQIDQATALKRVLKDQSLDRDQFADILRQFSPPHPDEKALVISGKHTYASQARTLLGYLAKENRIDREKTITAAKPAVTIPTRPIAQRPNSGNGGRVVIR
jgi:predicted kinase